MLHVRLDELCDVGPGSLRESEPYLKGHSVFVVPLSRHDDISLGEVLAGATERFPKPAQDDV